MPRKIRLTLETLAVDSFETGAGTRADGTVHAQQILSAPNPCIPQTAIQTCARKQSYYESCIAFCECTDRFRACLV